MNIIINDKEITLKYTMRSMMIYEKITNESFNPKGITQILIYFYSTILASNRDTTLTFEEFMDWIDENPDAMPKFNEWLMSVLNKNAYIAKNEKEGEDIDPKKS